MKQIPVIRTTDLDSITPARLQDDIDYTVFQEFVDFTHRNADCEPNRLVSTLGAAIDNATIEYGDTLKPVTISELNAVDIVLETLVLKYPSWFGKEPALDELDQPVSNIHLSADNLRERYFANQLSPECKPIQGDDWEDQKLVIIPMLALMLDELRQQINVDEEAARKDGQESIKRTVMEEVFRKNLSEEEVQAAVREALNKVESR